MVRRGCMVVLTWFACACSSESLSKDGDRDSPGHEQVSFAPCSLSLDGRDIDAECASVEVPLLADEPEGRTIPLFVQRLRATQPRRGQLWILPGGPGATGQSHAWYAEHFANLAPDLDIYLPDHRGVGHSAAIGCFTSAGITNACGDELRSEWGAGLDGFRTTEAARDIATLIHATRRHGDRVFVHGGSYGGYWLHRLLQLEPDLLDGAVFESSVRVLSTDGMLANAKGPDEPGRALLALCAADAVCHERLGDDPYARAADILANIDTLCPAYRDPPSGLVQQLLSFALFDAELMRAIPALFSRLERCTDDDIEWVGHFFDAATVGSETLFDENDFNPVLNVHIMTSEILEPASEVSLKGVEDAILFNNSTRMQLFLESTTGWPVYAADEFSNRWAETDVPLLVVHGALDVQTPLSSGLELAAHFASSTLVSFPSAQHGVIASTSFDENGENCASSIIQRFMNAPGEPLDLACVDAEPPFRFEPSAEWLIDTFGSDNLWGE